MSSNSETGHAKNVANFQDLIEFTTSFGPIYNPFKSALQVSELNNLKTIASTRLQEVITKNTEFNRRVNERILVFDKLSPLATRLINALKITNADSKTLEDAKGFVRKIRGKRISKVVKLLDPNFPAPKSISTSQLSFDQLVQHFSGLISILSTQPGYKPNEDDLKVEFLLVLLEKMEAKNNAVAAAYAAVTSARLDRDTILYSKNDGLVTIALEVKAYIKAAFGASSPQFKQVQGIDIRRIK